MPDGMTCLLSALVDLGLLPGCIPVPSVLGVLVILIAIVASFVLNLRLLVRDVAEQNLVLLPGPF